MSMPVEDQLRDFFTREADRQPCPTGLYQRAVADGTRLRRRRRAVQIASSVTIAGVAAAVVILAPGWVAGGHRAHVPATPPGPLSGSATPSYSPSPAAPWWKTWTTGRSYGTPPSPAFLAAAAPGDHVQVFADGTLPDGEEFVMYLDPATGHAVQYVQGWGNSPDYGTGDTNADPRMNDYIIQLSSTAAVRSVGSDTSSWAIVIGRPGTTAIDYSINGGPWQPMHVSNGIGVLAHANGQPSDMVTLRLIDTSGQYARDSFMQFAPPPVTAPAGPQQSGTWSPGNTGQPVCHAGQPGCLPQEQGQLPG
jgi:hypothetical protein